MSAIVLGQDDAVGNWVCREIGKLWVSGAGRALGWVDEKGAPIAGVTFTNFDGANVWLDCAAKPKTRWLDRRGLFCIFDYVFRQLECARCSAAVPESNALSQKLLEQGGFEYETRLVRAAPLDADMLIYRMFREDCKWIIRA